MVARPPRRDDGYEAHREAQAERQRELSARGRDIGDIPPVKDPDRRARTRGDLRLFLEEYLGHKFPLAWSDAHLQLIATIQLVTLAGGRVAFALPRGSGKSTISEGACLWATLHGHHQFVMLLAASKEKANDSFDAIRLDLESNDLLLEDFPEVCYPIRMLEGEPRRCAGQTVNGNRTLIEWTADRLAFPRVPGSAVAGTTIRVVGITGSFRGSKHTLPDGRVIRPSLLILDDLQTEESAASPSQVQRRLRLVNQAAANLAGPGQQIAMVLPCTVLEPDDLADRLLDRERSPEWRGIRVAMVGAYPKHMELWEQYAAIRQRSLRTHGDNREGTAFYLRNRAAMDEGAEVYWEERKYLDDVSALQHAMDRRADDPFGFACEMQQDPREGQETRAGQVTALDITRRLNGLKRAVVPDGVTCITAGVDIQETALFYLVAAWREDFTGFVLDYGAWPSQGGRDYYTLSTLRPTFETAYPDLSLEGAIDRALRELYDERVGASWADVTGAEHRVARAVVDANWAKSTETVFAVARVLGTYTPGHGRGIGPADTPMTAYRQKPGERFGLNWLQPAPKRGIRHVTYDGNWWKSFVRERLACDQAAAGALTLWGGEPDVHRMLADHCCAETSTRTEGKGRTVDVWRLRTGGPDNHLHDCLVMAAVAASMEGCAMPQHEDARDRAQAGRRRIKLSELAARKRRA